MRASVPACVRVFWFVGLHFKCTSPSTTQHCTSILALSTRMGCIIHVSVVCGWVAGWVYRRMYGQIDRQTDVQTDGCTDRRTDGLMLLTPPYPFFPFCSFSVKPCVDAAKSTSQLHPRTMTGGLGSRPHISSSSAIGSPGSRRHLSQAQQRNDEKGAEISLPIMMFWPPEL